MTADGNDYSHLDQFEVGANYFELIEFSLMRQLPTGEVMKGIYGVNVAKVREVVHMPRINPLASAVPGIAGIFELRGVPIPAINLCHVLGDPAGPLKQNQQIVVTEFSQKRAGFIVDLTHRIRRVGWDKVLPPSSDHQSFISGMILIEKNEFLFILDLEKILIEIEGGGFGIGTGRARTQATPEATLQTITDQMSKDPRAPGILFVDDSKLILSNVGKALVQKGFRVMFADNGAAALKKLEQNFTTGDSFGRIDAVITDVEMPQMDGLTLVRKVRENPIFNGLPIILHTSLSGEATQAAGQAVGADGYVIKNDIPQLVVMVEKMLRDLSARSAS